MPAPDDDMSIREIARTIADFRQEFRTQLGHLLRADVYAAQQALVEQRLASLEKDRDTAEARADSTRKIALTAVFGAVGTIVTALLLIALR
jgi:hypothetical protein